MFLTFVFIWFLLLVVDPMCRLFTFLHSRDFLLCHVFQPDYVFVVKNSMIAVMVFHALYMFNTSQVFRFFY